VNGNEPLKSVSQCRGALRSNPRWNLPSGT
jgi:hypothetical protein